MDINLISRLKYARAVAWTVLICCVIVAIAASLARAAIDLKAALIDKPDLAVYLLDRDATDATLIRAGKFRRDYLVETTHGPMLFVLRQSKEDGVWRVQWKEPLH